MWCMKEGAGDCWRALPHDTALACHRRALFPALIPAIAPALSSPPIAFNCYSSALAPINISYGDHVHEVRIMFPLLKVKLDQTLNSRHCILYIERVFFLFCFLFFCYALCSVVMGLYDKSVL